MDRNIGEKIWYSIAYARKCTHRFDDAGNLRCKKYGNLVGYVVGIRSVIMSEFKYKYGGYDNQSSASGKRETVYLVTDSIRKEPLIVRECDIVPF